MSAKRTHARNRTLSLVEKYTLRARMCTRVQARANLYGILCVAVWPRYALLQSLADLGQMPNTPTASDVARHHQRTSPKPQGAPRLAFPASTYGT